MGIGRDAIFRTGRRGKAAAEKLTSFNADISASLHSISSLRQYRVSCRRRRSGDTRDALAPPRVYIMGHHFSLVI